MRYLGRLLLVVRGRNSELTLPHIIIGFTLGDLLRIDFLNDLNVVRIEVIEENVSLLLVELNYLFISFQVHFRVLAPVIVLLCCR